MTAELPQIVSDDRRHGERRADRHTPETCFKLLDVQTTMDRIFARLQEGDARMDAIVKGLEDADVRMMLGEDVLGPSFTDRIASFLSGNLPGPKTSDFP